MPLAMKQVAFAEHVTEDFTAICVHMPALITVSMTTAMHGMAHVFPVRMDIMETDVYELAPQTVRITPAMRRQGIVFHARTDFTVTCV